MKCNLKSDVKLIDTGYIKIFCTYQLDIHFWFFIDFVYLAQVQGVPPKMFSCLRGYNSPKNIIKNKSIVVFEILTKFSLCWMLKFFIFGSVKELKKC